MERGEKSVAIKRLHLNYEKCWNIVNFGLFLSDQKLSISKTLSVAKYGKGSDKCIFILHRQVHSIFAFGW